MLSNATILLVRHGEKENPSRPDEKGTDPFLSDLGWTRAQKYVDYFHSYSAEKIDGTDPVPITLGHLFASADHLDVSYRPHQTLQPLANATQLPLDLSYENSAYADLVKELAHPRRYDQANILICWHHGEIIDLATALLGAGSKKPPKLSAASDWPAKWPSDVFGWLMQIRYDVNGAAQSDWVRCINEHLMPDDTKDPPGP
jgi:hypothetical protein